MTKRKVGLVGEAAFDGNAQLLSWLFGFNWEYFLYLASVYITKLQRLPCSCVGAEAQSGAKDFSKTQHYTHFDFQVFLFLKLNMPPKLQSNCMINSIESNRSVLLESWIM